MHGSPGCTLLFNLGVILKIIIL